MEVEVEWFMRDVSGGDERRIVKAWVADEESGVEGPVEGKVYSFNTTELRMIDVEMQIVPPVGGVPLNIVRPARRSQRIRGLVCQQQQQRADLPEQLWEIPAGNERIILDICCR